MTRTESRAATRRQILDTAQRAFAREGFGGATIGAIATEAGFTKGAIYSNFEGKEQLFLEVMKEYQEQSRISAIAIFESAPSKFEIVERLGRWADVLAQDGAWSFLALEYARHVGTDSSFRIVQSDMMRENWLVIGSKLRPMFRDDLPADAEMLGTLVFELTHAPLSGLTASPTVGDLIRLTFNGLLAAYGVAESI